MVVLFLDIVRTFLVNEISLCLHRLNRIEVGRERLVFHIDQLDRAFGDFFVNGSDTCDIVADVADLLDRKRRLVMADGKYAVLVGRVCASDDGNHAFERLGTRCVNALDARMRVRGMKDLADQHSGQAEIVRVLTGAGGLARGVHHGDRFADD